MPKRNSKGQFVKGSGDSKSSGKRKGKRKGKRGASGALSGRVAKLEANQARIVAAHNALESRVTGVEREVGRIASVLGERFKPRVVRGGRAA